MFVLACEELHTYACNSVSKNEPPLVKADYGPEDYTDAPYLWSMFGWKFMSKIIPWHQSV